MIGYKVESSIIDVFGYNEQDLYIRFQSGKIYVYRDVDFQTFAEFQSANSFGTYFNERIKSVFRGYELPREDILFGAIFKDIIDSKEVALQKSFERRLLDISMPEMPLGSNTYSAWDW